MEALRINTESRECRIPIGEVELLIRELGELQNTYPGAANAATILQSGLDKELVVSAFGFKDGEEKALLAVLDKIHFSDGLLDDGLRCLWEGINIDADPNWGVTDAFHEPQL